MNNGKLGKKTTNGLKNNGNNGKTNGLKKNGKNGKRRDATGKENGVNAVAGGKKRNNG